MDAAFERTRNDELRLAYQQGQAVTALTSRYHLNRRQIHRIVGPQAVIERREEFQRRVRAALDYVSTGYSMGRAAATFRLSIVTLHKYAQRNGVRSSFGYNRDFVSIKNRIDSLLHDGVALSEISRLMLLEGTPISESWIKKHCLGDNAKEAA